MHRSTLVCNKSRQFDARHMHKHAHKRTYGRTHEYCTITTITTPVALMPYPDSLNARMSTIAIDTTSRGRGPLSCTGLPTARHSQVIRNRGSRSTEPIQYYHPLITAKAQSPVNCRSFTPNVCVFQTVAFKTHEARPSASYSRKMELECQFASCAARWSENN